MSHFTTEVLLSVCEHLDQELVWLRISGFAAGAALIFLPKKTGAIGAQEVS
jgi:hypothetical protein